MKRRQNGVVWLAIALLCAGVAGTCRGDGLAIQSFNGTGQLTFNTLNDGTGYVYRVEWAPTPGGPWTNTWASLVGVQGSGIVTCSVPMCYRVVASHAHYIVVDVSGGTSATSYPLSYYGSLADVPGGATNDAYKTTNLLFRLISSGTFTMGSPVGELGRASEETQHVVTITQPFFMGVFEVTQKQWERVMGDWPSYFNNASCRDSRPVEQVSYDAIRGANVGTNWPANSSVDATSFMGRLRFRTGLAFDLPTEAQWEYAGRAGTTTALNSGYDLASTGSDTHMNAVGRYYYNGGSGWTQNGDTSVATAKVGSYLPNAWGLYDIHGNVGEYCLDWAGAYPPGPVVDPAGASSGSNRVKRGGGWSNIASETRAASRVSTTPAWVYYSGGFRVALTTWQQ